MNHYKYKGPVTNFDICTTNNWASETYAVSEKKALSNFKYQYKKLFGISSNSGKIGLPGKITVVEN